MRQKSLQRVLLEFTLGFVDTAIMMEIMNNHGKEAEQLWVGEAATPHVGPSPACLEQTGHADHGIGYVQAVVVCRLSAQCGEPRALALHDFSR
jgi:hypothetical protein